MKKLAIIGASYLQEPLIQKAKSMGIETHVFAWAANDVGEKSADYFYPISIVEKDKILETCREIRIDGICSIASDLASITVNYVAHALGLVCNSPECVMMSTNKHNMRKCFEEHQDPSPKSVLVQSMEDLKEQNLTYPIIVKPVDRSGSRGITKLTNETGLEKAIEDAEQEGFMKCALVEEFATGQEYSVECISWKGNHHFLALTKKYTTGTPHFIEMGHLEPAPIEKDKLEEIKQVVFHALNSLQVENGASHSEIKISKQGKIAIIEIGARMGGDMIGSHLVELSTGVDFVKAVIQIALGEEPDLTKLHEEQAAAVRFVFTEDDIKVLNDVKEKEPQLIVEEDIHNISTEEVTDSSARFGYYILAGRNHKQLEYYLPKGLDE